MIAEKNELRRLLRAKAREFPTAARTADSVELCRRVLAQSIWQRARAVMLFVPWRDEPDLWPLLRDARATGKTLTLPRHIEGTETYVPAVVADLQLDLVPGRFGILEPVADCPEWPVNRLDLILVPGLGFDPSGGRLGRGLGHYDRLLTQATGFTCGVGFDWQILDALPQEPHDIRLHGFVTPTRWHEVSGGARV